MSEELFNSASCSGDCADCGSDCQDLDQPTVTLTLDDDTEVKCAVLTIFPAPNQKEYIALLPLDETLKRLQNPAGDLIFLPGFSLFFSQIPIISYLYSFSASLFKICFYSFTDV